MPRPDQRLSPAGPTEAATLARAAAVVAAVCLVMVVYPFSPTAPRGLVAALTVLGATVATVLHRNADRCPRVAVHGVLGLATVLVTVCVTQSTTPNGIVVASVSYLWIGTYAATFHDRPAVLAHLGTIGLGLAVGLWGAGAGAAGQTWFFLMATTAGISWILNEKVALLRQEAMTDPLTKTLSRRAFRAAAEVEMARAARTGQDLTLVLLDLDDFKRVNDEHGHAAGDAVLTGLAGSWRHTLRAGEVMGRYGGDEFTLLLPATDAAQARQLLDRMHRSNASCSWSAGLAQWRGQDFDEWLRSADAQLYAEKTS